MYSRQSLFEIFSTFIEFRSDRFHRWGIDHQLRRNLELYQETLSKLAESEDSWALYWHTCWTKQPDDAMALGHLSAYLQEACYWSAQKIIGFLGNTSYNLPDCFQLMSVENEKILAGYDPGRGASLKGYARIAYSSLIRDILRQRQEVEICTGWTLLRRTSKQRIVAALGHAGVSKTAMGPYRLAWICYKTLYGYGQTSPRKLKSPGQQQWDEIATLYNVERLTQLPEPGPALTPEMLKQRLTQCAVWLREYMYPSVRSLNVPAPNRDVGELQDLLSDSRQSSLLAALIEVEELQQRQLQQGQINDVLDAAIKELIPEHQVMLRSYYQDGLTQVQMAQQLEMKQYTVSRRLNRIRRLLLSTLTDWAKTLHISISPDLIANMSAALEEWLAVYYRDQT